MPLIGVTIAIVEYESVKSLEVLTSTSDNYHPSGCWPASYCGIILSCLQN